MAANTVWGLDIGNSAIKAVKIVRTAEGCKIDEFDIVDIPAGEDEKERPGRVRAALNTLTTNHRFGNDPVHVAVAGNVCLHREFQLPPGSEDKLDDLVQYEAKQQIPFPLDQVEWGYERYEDPNGVGVALIAVRKNDIQDLLSLAQTHKLNIRGITPSALALFNFVQYEFKPDGTTLILDAGAKGIDFVVMNKRQIYFRTIQIAGREITRVLENKFKVPYEKAEDLKKNISKSPQADKIMSVIEPTLRQVGAEVQRTIGFYKSKARGQRIQQCYLLGHTFRLPKMAEYLQTQVREAPFALVEGLQRVKLDLNINAEVWNTEFPTMAVAIGLGIQGLELSELKLNLIPQTKKEEIARAKWKVWAVGAAAAVMAALWFSYVEAGKASERYKTQIVKLEKDEKNAKRYEEDELRAVAGVPERLELLRRYSRVAHDSGKIAQIFPRLVALRTPDTGKPFFGAENKIYLTNLYVSRIPLGAAKLDGFTEGPERASLKTSEALTGKNCLYASLINPKAADPFSLPAESRPDVPLVVVMTGEVESGPLALTMLSKLEEVLKKFEEVKEVRIERVPTEVTYTEPTLEYTWGNPAKNEPPTLKGAALPGGAAPAPAPPPPATAPAPGTAEAPKDRKIQHTVFHAIFRWNDKSDPDTEPVEAAAQAKVEKGAKKK